jgi:hypothetical protein
MKDGESVDNKDAEIRISKLRSCESAYIACKIRLREGRKDLI